MANNYINFVTSLIYGDLGAAELGLPAGGAPNHFNWTLDQLPPASPVTGTEFLNHHVTVMLGRYETWRRNNRLPPVLPWNGTDVFPYLITPAVNPAPVAALFAPAFPGGYTENQLGDDVRTYYDRLRDASAGMGLIRTELDDEIKAPFSYRYWAFMKWVSDLRKRLLGQPVLPVGLVYDRDGTILSEKEFMDMFNSVHHVWHPFSDPPAAWTDATPGYKTSVGQRRRKKAGTFAQVGAEFFTFHRDHLLVMDRWLARTGQDPVQSINTCAHDLGIPPVSVSAPLDVIGGGLGYPVVNYATRSVNFAPTHNTIWDGTRPGVNLGAFASLGQMGQLFAPDSAGGSAPVPGVPSAEGGYHGEGHILNGDLRTSYVNNFSPRFFAWHGFIDTIWERRQPRFTTFVPLKTDLSPFVNPQVLTIIRDPAAAGPDSVEPANAIAGIDLANGNGTLRCRINVRADQFSRPLQLALRCDVLREAGGAAPVITLTRNLTITTGAPVNPNERQQGLDFTVEFVFDGTAGTVDTAGKGPFASDNTPAGGTVGVGFLNSLVRVTGTLTCNVQPNGSAGLDGFDHEERIDIPLIQEKSAPAITAYLDRSTFSIGQVQAMADPITGESRFDDAFYIAIQDRTARPAPIPWPPDVEPQLYGLLAPPVPAAGLFYPDPTLTRVLSVELRDAVTNAALTGDVAVVVTAADPEDPTLHPSVPQRITYRCRVVFTGTGAFAALTMANQVRLLKLVVTARDRSGNQVTDDSALVRLQFNENPYMLDGPVSWLSIDTRVFQVRQGQSRFGVTMGADPNAFIDQVIVALRLGNGTAGGESFDSLSQDQAGSALEYSTIVGGSNVYNFALAKVHLQSTSGALGVRASFRLFRWGVANVSFDNGLAYRSAASGVALLGQTSSGELASIPFFSAPRGGLAADMNAQLDDRNRDDFPSGDVSRVFGAYLDINRSAVQFPQSFMGDGGFGAVPPAQMRSIRDLLISHHQCMVVEVFYPPDPTLPGANPGTSDNLSQRNLMILQTANPGSAATRTIQHSFNIDLTRQRRQGQLTRGRGEQPLTHMAGTPGERDDDDQAALPIPLPARPARSTTFGHAGGGNDHGVDQVQLLWIAQFPEVVEELRARGRAQEEEMSRWQFDPDQWKSNDGLDELVFFWNNLPQDSQVEVYLPGAGVEEIINYRNLRHAPGTVQIVDSGTLSLRVAGPTYLPIPPFWGDNLAGLVTVTLPAGIKEGQKFLIDVVQMRSDSRRVLGGFQLNIQVGKAKQLFEPEKRLLEIFHQRLSLTPSTSRWRPILERQVEFIRERARGFVEQLNDPNVKWEDPTEHQQGQNVRLVLERIEILDDRDPFIKDAGEFRFKARIYSRNNDGLLRETRFPEKGHYSISDKPGRNMVQLNLPLFEGFVEDHLAVEITGIEMDTFDPDDEICRYRRIFMGPPESWLGSFGPGAEKIEPEDLGDWRLWYRIERA